MTDVPDFEMDETIEGYEADLRELRARLSAAEQEVQERIDAAVLVAVEAQNACSAAEARAEAAEQALSKIAYPARSDWLPGEWPEVIRRMQAIARAALAGREETGGG